MEAIMTGIQMQDNASSILYNIYDAVNLVNSSIENLCGSIDAAATALHEMNGAAQEISAPEVAVPAPIQWQSGGPQVFEGSGLSRFRQEAQSANAIMQQLSGTQNLIAAQALYTDVLSPEAYSDIIGLSVRIDHLRDKIQMISVNRANFGTDRANAGLEQLRQQLDSAVRQQEDLNTAMESGDLSAINSAYVQLSETVGGTERYIRNNTNEQGAFNQQIEKGASSSSKLIDSIKKVAAEYLSIQKLKDVLNMSDNLAQTTAQLDAMGQGFGEAGMSGQELMNGVYLSAQNARSSMSGMADVVASFGNNARDAFESPQEVIDFANLVQKQMAIAGVSMKDAADAQMQLAKSFGSGSLSGDDLTSIFGQAPNLIQNISDYMGLPIERIREMASEGGITADVVKASIFSASDEINEKFSQMPATWGQIWQTFQDSSMNAFQPTLQKISELAGSPEFQNFVSGAIGAMTILAGIVLNVFSLISSVGGFIADNWSVIAPIIGGVVAAFAIYYGWLILTKVATAIFSVVQGILNAVMSMSPVMLIVIGLILLISVIYAICSAIAKATGAASSGFGIILGCVFVVKDAFVNFGLLVANIALGILEAFKALCKNMPIAFHNAIKSIKSGFYGLLSTALTVVAGICEALNKLPFVDFDYSGIEAAANNYAAKAEAEKAAKKDYISVSDAFDKGFHTYDTFKDGWAKDAFDKGAAVGDGFADKVSDLFSGFTGGAGEEFENQYNTDPYNGEQEDSFGYSVGGGMGSDAAKTAANTGETAANTAVMADSLDVTNEQLKYLRDIAERDIINRFTTASIKVEMTNHNNVNSSMDLDGIVDGLATGVMNAMSKTAAGVHI